MTPKSKARAQCGSPARWDLCGGQPEPTKAKGCPYRNCDRTKASESEPQLTCRKALDDIKTRSTVWAWDEPGENLLIGQVVSGMDAARASVRLLYGTWEPVVSRDDQPVVYDLRLLIPGKASSGGNREGEFLMRGTGADRPVVAMKVL
jgi:hypothetical protein